MNVGCLGNDLGIEEDEDESSAVDLSIRTAFLDEKSSACHAIGIFAQEVGAAFVPYPYFSSLCSDSCYMRTYVILLHFDDEFLYLCRESYEIASKFGGLFS